MNKKILAILFLFILAQAYLFCQNAKSKLSFGSSIDFVLMGTGDYLGIGSTNSLRVNLSKSLRIMGGLGFSISSNSGKKNVLYTHNYGLISGDMGLELIPIDANKFYFEFGIGPSVRYRSQIEVTGFSSVNSVVTLYYKNENSYDLGYFAYLGLGVKASTVIDFLINIMIHSYNKGTETAAFGLGINIKFK